MNPRSFFIARGRLNDVLAHALAAVLLAVGLCAASALSALAQQTASVPASAVVSFDVPAGALDAAIVRFGQQSGLQFSVGSELTGGKRSGGLKGRYTLEDGLRALLVGSGLTFRFIGPRTVLIQTALDVGDARLLGPLRIEGMDGGSTASAANGSNDPTVTEGTGSYTTGVMRIASKIPLAIKDTPQSVSVVTAQRMQDQNIADFSALMKQSTGVSTITGTDGPLQEEYYSRGFRIQRLQIDGGAPMDIGGNDYSLVPQIDMAMYDHAELLRGADGLFNGYGEPGGVINLARKQPLDHPQVIIEGQHGSWNNERTQIDASAPLGFDGRLRGRSVLAYQDQDYFYDTASSNKTVAYGILAYELTPATTLSGGASSTRQDNVPFLYGLPRYQSGADLGLPRATCLCFPWNRYDLDTRELFAKVDHSLGEHWNLQLNLTRTEQQRSYKYGYVSGMVNPESLIGPRMTQTMGDRASKQIAADFTMNGEFFLFGHSQVLVFGGNYADVDGAGYKGYTPVLSGSARPYVDVIAFDPNDPDYHERASGLVSTKFSDYGSRQAGLYANMTFTPWGPLHIDFGVRYSYIGSDTSGYYSCDVQCLPYSRKYSANDLSWPPRVSVSYDLNEDMTLYLGYTDIYQDQSTLVDHGGKAIDPLTGSNWEGGIKWSSPVQALDANISFYRIKVGNYPYRAEGDYGQYPATHGLLPDGIHYCCYTNNADQEEFSQGVDAEVSGEIARGWQLSASWVWNENEYRGSVWSEFNSGKPMVSRQPKHIIKLWSSYAPQGGDWLQRLNFGLGVNAVSKGYYTGSVCLEFDASGNCIGDAVDYDFTQGFHAVFAARVAYRINAHWNAALNLENIFDRNYYQTVGSSSQGNWYGEPRNFMLTMRGRF